MQGRHKKAGSVVLAETGLFFRPNMVLHALNTDSIKRI